MSPMVDRAGARRPTRAVILASTVAALVLGILGMHALNLHAAHGSHHGAEPASLDLRADTHLVSSGHDQTPAAAHPASDPPRDSAAQRAHGGDDGRGMSGMVMLCMAMLAAGSSLILVVRRLAAGLRTGHTIRRPHVAQPRPGAVTHRSNGPPPAWRFSVITC